MKKTDVIHVSPSRRAKEAQRTLIQFTVSIAGLFLAAKLAIAAPSFVPTVNVTDALLKDGHSKVWKQHPGFNDPDQKYFIAARRSDGAIAIVTRSVYDPKNVSLLVYFIKCGVPKDFSSIITNAATFNAALAHPAIDDPSAASLPIEEGSAMNDLYQSVCAKNR